jgi:hypothetical protein
MKNSMKTIAKVLDNVYGWGIMLALLLGGLTFFGYLAAFIIGGESAAAISTFIYKGFFPVVIYAANIIVILGLVSMYLKHEKSLTIETDKKEATDTTQETEQ